MTSLPPVQKRSFSRREPQHRPLSGWFLVAACICLLALMASCAKRPSLVTPLPGVRMSGSISPGFAGGLPGRQPLLDLGPATDQEVWVLARGPQATAAGDLDIPGSGSLMAKIEQKEVPMPLKHTDVHAQIGGYLGAVDVTQQFHNPYSGKIEAVYVFPLPHNAAVNEFIMTIGERRIRGIIRERQEAERVYQEAKRQGYVASLLTEERPNVFTQSVANIEPGKAIDIRIRYFQTLTYNDGWYEFVFPMVVGPRFNPPGTTNGIGAVARGATGSSGQSTELPYLRPDERTGHDIGLKVEVDAGVPIEEFRCTSHRVVTESATRERMAVSLEQSDTLPNRDFVFRYRVGGAAIKPSLMTHKDERGGFFTLMLYPPAEFESLERQPLELVFVLDCSGSMSGKPIEHAKAAIERGLQLLRPGDSFQIIEFSLKASQLGNAPLEATPENLQAGLNYLQSLRSGGGTMMITGIKAALDFPHDPQRLRFVCFLTDGYIGNEVEILGEIHKRLGASRIFSFGIGSAVNRYLLDNMAKTGRGAVAYLGPRDSASQIMEEFFRRTSHPALTDVAVDWGNATVADVFPRHIPDLFVGRPVILTGRFRDKGDSQIQVSGRVGGEQVRLAVNAPFGSAQTHAGLPSVWARMKIADLAEESIIEPNKELPEQIKKLALDFSLMSSFTAFVAVDSSRRTEGDEGTTVPIAVPVPEGVKYETTVPEK